MTWLLVAIGSALGGVSRHAISVSLTRLGQTFPWGTFAVNVLGSFVIGMVAALAATSERASSTLWARDFVMIGFLGGFTTFSAFSLQTLQLLRDGKVLIAGTNVVGSVALCLVACWLGFAVGARLGSS